MTTALKQLAESHAEVMRITVDQYHRMMETGILQEGDPFELINGFIIRKDRSAVGEDPMTVGHEHIWSVKMLARLNPKLIRLGCHMQTQDPVILTDLSEPAPDGTILLGDEDRYKSRKPVAAEVQCVIEVSASTLDYDRTTKLAMYANSGIPQYVIVNLPDRMLEIYTNPLAKKGRYLNVETLKPGMRLPLFASEGRRLEIAVRSLLP